MIGGVDRGLQGAMEEFSCWVYAQDSFKFKLVSAGTLG